MDLHHILALGFLPGITASALRTVMESGAELDEIRGATPEELASLGFRRAAIQAMAHPEPYLEQAREQIALCRHHGARLMTILDDDYPAPLREIYAAPAFLFVLGELPEEERIAIVGTRSASVYGRLAAERYAEDLVDAGVTVVSGLARGIDTFAHAAALGRGGRTIAVVASGLDRITPHTAATLAARIKAHGAVITEYPFGTRALRPYFPQRNRIISGISRATIVVESDERGGAMITAGFALDQNRDVFAVPGPITAPKSRGTNQLIRTDRARLTQAPRDVLESLGICLPAIASGGEESAAAAEVGIFERKILDALGAEPLHVDAICDLAGLGASEVLVSLLTLEFKGLVRQMAGKVFVRVDRT